MNDYSTLNSISDYSPVTKEINSNASLVKLNWNGGPKTGASETNSLKYLQDLSAGITNPDVDVYNIGRDNLDPSIYERGKNNAPTYVGLGHELGHVWDLLTTSPMSVKIFHFTQAAGVVTPNISYSEKNAMYWENVLRAHGNLPLRQYYNYDATNGFEYPANITIVKSVPILNGGKKPIANLQTITLTNLDGTQTHTFTRTK